MKIKKTCEELFPFGMAEYKKEYEYSFEPMECAVKSANGEHCPNMPHYRKSLKAWICDECYINWKEKNTKSEIVNLDIIAEGEI